MFLIPKKFEQTLRASPIQPATPAQPGSGLNPEFHRGCTGKAHACGTLKSRLAANNNTGTNKNGVHTQQQTNATLSTKSHPRKNSISSETISDSGSENSASWHSNDSMVTPNGRTTIDSASTSITQKVNGAKPALAKKPTLSAHSKEYAVAMAKALKAVDTPRSPMLSVKRGQSQQRNAIARTASPASTTPSSVNRRMRLHSDGDHSAENSLASSANTSMTAINSAQQSTFERTQKYRSFRITGRRHTAAASVNMNARPPWNSGAGMRNNNNMSIYSSHSGNNSSASGSGGTAASFNNRSFRSSLRRSTREALNWQTIWERSLALRGYGANSGVFKSYDEAIKQQV
nr:autotransporter adhesin BpaC-like [Bactrocera oleae]